MSKADEVKIDLDKLLTEKAPGRVVRKDLLHRVKGGMNVPSYVLEYLLGKYCATGDKNEIDVGLKAVNDTIKNNYFRHDEANKAQSLVEQTGQHRFIDRVEVRFVPSEGKYWATCENFNYNRIHVPEKFYKDYERLLEGGVWAIVDIEYREPDEDSKKASPFHIKNLKPIQLARFDFDEFCGIRSHFTTDQWLDIMLRSVGLEPDRMEQRLKYIFLTRLIPFVEQNYNFIELGPRGTGKSYVYCEMSPYGILLSGGKASTATLFYNNARRAVGLVGYWDVVAFDEVGGMKVTDPDTVQIMKDYMANGRFSRGVTQVLANASFAMVGNLNQPVDVLVANAATDLFQSLPKEFDLAILDRLHFYLPGWEIPKNSKDLLTNHYGFVTDYIAEAFRLLRKDNRVDAVERHFRFGHHCEGRDVSAIKRTVAGFLKLLHPDGNYTKDELRTYLELAMEGRRRVKEQLKKRGSFEFFKTAFSFIDTESDQETTVGCPEMGGNHAISADPLPPGMVYTANVDNESRVSIQRIEVTLTPGTGKLKTPSGMDKGLKESLNRAHSYLNLVKERMGLAPMLATRDLIVESVDLSGGHSDAVCGVAFFVAMMSAIQERRIQAGTVILGDLTIQGNIKGVTSLTEPLQMAMENGAQRALVPMSNKALFTSLPEGVVEQIDLVFYADIDKAVLKAVDI